MGWNLFFSAGKKRAFCRSERDLGLRWLLGVILLLSALLPCSGCSSRRPPPPQMYLYVESDKTINDGQLFYLVVRTLTDKQFLTDSYQQIAGLVFADPPDKSVIGSFVILPGNSQVFQVIQPEESPVAFYFMFTNPGDQWKKLLDQPIASAYNITVHKNGVTVLPRRSMWRRILWPFGS